MKLQDLGLCPELLRAVERRGYAVATPIQRQAIPLALEGRDVLGCAQTGTGKTAAFALPIIQQLVASLKANDSKSPATADQEGAFYRRPNRKIRPIRALVLVPTRELAVQVAGSFADYAKGLGLKQTMIFGGVSVRRQIDDLRRGVDIIVATPGRFLDLLSQGFMRLDQVRHLVLDEADQMFDMGFIRDVRKIIHSLPRERQTMMFSATIPDEIRTLSRECLTDPVHIAADPQAVAPDKIEQQIRFVRPDDKPAALADFLRGHARQRILVFCRTKHGADKIVRRLSAAQIRSVAIHGNKSQNARQDALQAFNEARPPILVATDVAARGLHLPDVKIVVNYELSDTPETYIHRIGRTARAGASGRALTFCAPNERSLVRRIENLTKVRMQIIQAEAVSPSEMPSPIQDPIEAPRSNESAGRRFHPMRHNPRTKAGGSRFAGRSKFARGGRRPVSRSARGSR